MVLLRLFSVFLLLHLSLHSVYSANILLLMGCASPSHHIWTTTLVNALADKGHNVTVLSTDIDGKAPQNVTYVHMEGVYDYMYKDLNVDLVSLHKETSTEAVMSLYAFGTVSCLGIVKSNGLQQMLQYPDNFKVDLILYDFTLGPCVLGFLHKFNYPPVVGITAYNNPAYTVEIVGGHNYYAYIPYCSLHYDSNMNFFQRLHNLYIHLYDYVHRNRVYLPAIDEMARQVFGNDYPYMGDLEKKTLIALVNTHPSIDFPEPLSPNIIPVGGLQIKDPKPLPKDLEIFINASQKAAVIFSLGTNVKSDKLGAEKQTMILKAFSEMPEYNFLWKFETDTLPMALPSNVMVKKWLPQNDILANSNIKAFITHGGALSTQEASWYGVPIICIPFFVDQFRNSYKSMKAGVGERILFEELTTEIVVKTVRKVLENPRYAANMKIRSSRFRDQPEKPLVRAVWWIEYILRNPNPEHLRSPVVMLGSFVSNLYDILLFCIVLISVVAFLIWKYVISKLVALIRGPKKVKKN